MTDRPSLRERKKEQTRIGLMRAAVDLFREKGYEATTVDDIVESANYSRSTFFRYFGSKEDVVFGDLSERMASFLGDLHQADSSRDPWQAVRETVMSIVPELVGEAPELEAECVALWFSEPALHRRYAEMILECEDIVARYLGWAWEVDPEGSVECQVAATAAIGVARTAFRSPLSDQAGVTEALQRGFAFFEEQLVGRRAPEVLPAAPRLPTRRGRRRAPA